MFSYFAKGKRGLCQGTFAFKPDKIDINNDQVVQI